MQEALLAAATEWQRTGRPPLGSGRKERLLHSVLSVVEVAAATYQRAEGSRGDNPEQALDVAGVGHCSGQS